MSNPNINPEIIKALKDRGLDGFGRSRTYNAIYEFQRDGFSDDVFNLFYTKPFLRILTQLLAMNIKSKNIIPPAIKENIRLIFGDVPELRDKIKEIMGQSPDKIFKCENCGEIVARYNIYSEEKPTYKCNCLKCRTTNDLSKRPDEDDWTFFESKFPFFIKPYLDDLINCKILTPSLWATCTRCNRVGGIVQINKTNLKDLTLEGAVSYLQGFYCERCSQIYDLIEQSYDFTVPSYNFFIKGNGSWFEWYLTKLLRTNYPKYPIEQGITANGKTMEIDALMLRDNKIITFSCKALNPYKNAKFKEIADALRYIKFADEIVVISTAIIPDDKKQTLIDSGEGKITFIEASKIEDINKILG